MVADWIRLRTTDRTLLDVFWPLLDHPLEIAWTIRRMLHICQLVCYAAFSGSYPDASWLLR